MLCIPTNNAMPADRIGSHLVDEVRTLDAELATRLGVPVIRADVVGAAGALLAPGTSIITQSSAAQCCAKGVEEGELVVAQLRSEAGPRHSASISAPVVQLER